MGRRPHALTASIVVLAWGGAGAAALALTGTPPAAGAALPATTAAAAAPTSSTTPAVLPAADRARLARLRRETTRLEREVVALRARFARRGPAVTVPAAHATTPTPAHPAGATGAPHSDGNGDDGGGDGSGDD